MANLDAPHGFVPVKAPYGNDVPSQEYTLADSITVYPGMILFMAATGLLGIYAGGATGRLNIVGAALDYVAAADTDRSCSVANDPNQQFSAQTDDNTVTVLADYLGANFTAINLTTASATRLISLAEIDGSSADTTNTSTTIRPFRAVRFQDSAENVLSTSFASLIVKINPINHILANDVGV